MATYYWRGGVGTGVWDNANTSNWSTSASGGTTGAGPPTSADNVIFDANSAASGYTVTVGATAVCADITVSAPATGVAAFSFANTSILSVYGNFTLAASSSTWTGTGGASIYFRATTTGKTIQTSSIPLITGATGGSLLFSGLGGGWTLSDSLQCANVTVAVGSFDSGGKSITCSASFQSTGTSTRSVTLGASIVTVSSSAIFSGASGLTLSAASSTFTLSNASASFTNSTGTTLTFGTVNLSSTGLTAWTISGNNNFTTLNITGRGSTGLGAVTIGGNQTVSGTLTLNSAGTNPTMRIFVTSDVVGTARILSAGTLSAQYVDFRNITAAGTATWSGTSFGDCLGNSGITFATPKTVYWNLAGSQGWSSPGWATTNNGTPAVANFPLAQDTAYFTEAGAAGTIGMGASWNIGTISTNDGVSPRLTSFTLTLNNLPTVYGNLTFTSAVTVGGQNPTTFAGQGVTRTITTAGSSQLMDIAVTVNAPGGTLTLGSDTTIASTRIANLTAGTLNLNNFTLSAGVLVSDNSNTRAITFGSSGKIVLTGSGTTVVNMSTTTGFSVDAGGTRTIELTYSGATGIRNLAIGGGVPPAEANTLDIYVKAGSDTVNLSNSTSYRILDFATGSTFTGAWTLAGGTGTAYLYGDLRLNANMTAPTSSGNLYFRASNSRVIASAGKTLDCLVVFDNISGVPGSWTLQDNMTVGVTRTITLTNGTISLSSYTLSMGLFSSNNSNVRAINFGTGKIALTGTNASVWSVTNLTNFSSSGSKRVELAPAVAPTTGTRTIASGSSTPGTTQSSTTENAVTDFYILSGSDTVTFSGNSNARTLDFTGFSGTANLGATNFMLYGDFTFSSSATLSVPFLHFVSTSATTRLLDFAGVTIAPALWFDSIASTGSWKLQRDATSTATTVFRAGTLDLNGKTLTVTTFDTGVTSTRALALNGGTLVLTATSGTAFYNPTPTGWSMPGTVGTISLTNASSKTFVGGGGTYNATLNQGGAGALQILGSNTFYDITASAYPSTVTLAASATQTVSNFSLSGVAGSPVTLNSTSSGTRGTLSKASGSVLCSYLTIQDNAATGGATWVAQLSTNAGNNTGWTFYSGTAPLSVPVLGNSAVGYVGTVTVPQPIAFGVTGVQAYALVGSVVTTAGASATLTGLSATGYTGTITVIAGAVTSLTGVSATGSLGTVTTSGKSNIALAGVVATGYASTASVSGKSNLTLTGTVGTGAVGTVTERSSYYLSGVSATATTGTITAKGGSTLTLSGVYGTGYITTVLVWGLVDDSQTANWTPVNDSDTVVWTQIPT